MSLQMRWVGESELDRVAETRWMCYSHARKELERYKQNLRQDPRARPGDYLLAEQNGRPLGTATSLPLTMWVRGSPIPCQGVADVGTIKSARRRGGAEPGIASAIMREVLKIARERSAVVSALMPFRASFYEHFGYGLVERRSDWTIPLSIVPPADCAGWRLATPEDRSAQADQWQSAIAAGQCEVERSPARWKHRLPSEEEGMVFIDRPNPTGPESTHPVRAYAFITQENISGCNNLKVNDWSADSPETFASLLAFLSTMRDQFSTLTITTPADLPLGLLLREPQLPHRLVDHPAAEMHTITRMQLRILDHRKFLESLHLPPSVRGRVTVAIKETEGSLSRFTIEFEAGRAHVTPSTGSADFECLDRHWASIATGDLLATQAVRWNAARQSTPNAAAILDALSTGPLPFCREYF